MQQKKELAQSQSTCYSARSITLKRFQPWPEQKRKVTITKSHVRDGFLSDSFYIICLCCFLMQFDQMKQINQEAGCRNTKLGQNILVFHKVYEMNHQVRNKKCQSSKKKGNMQIITESFFADFQIP